MINDLNPSEDNTFFANYAQFAIPAALITAPVYVNWVYNYFSPDLPEAPVIFEQTDNWVKEPKVTEE